MSILRIPGPLDPHVHLRGMDWSHKGDFATETAAALAGGYTAVLDMPNTPPETARPEALARKRRELDRTSHCDWGVYYGAHPQGNLETFPEAFQGVVGLKIYCNPTTGFMYMRGRTREEHFAAWRDHGLVAVHAEEEEVAAVLELVDRYRIRTHFCHISTRTELDMLREGKRSGLPISAGACPHHLFLTDQDLPRLGSFGMMKPPLKTQADQDALWEALSDGLLDVVESDHAPHSLAEKQAGRTRLGCAGRGDDPAAAGHGRGRGSSQAGSPGAAGVRQPPPHFRHCLSARHLDRFATGPGRTGRDCGRQPAQQVRLDSV